MLSRPLDVCEHPVEGEGRAIDAMKPRLRAGIELGPDLSPCRREDIESRTNPVTMEQRGVGQQAEPNILEPVPRTDRDHRSHRVGKARRCGRLSITREADVSPPPQGRCSRVERGVFPEISRDHHRQQRIELGGEHIEIYPTISARYGAINLAIRAVKVACLVRVEVDSNAQPAHATRHHGVHVAIVAEHPSVIFEV